MKIKLFNSRLKEPLFIAEIEKLMDRVRSCNEDYDGSGLQIRILRLLSSDVSRFLFLYFSSLEIVGLATSAYILSCPVCGNKVSILNLR